MKHIGIGLCVKGSVAAVNLYCAAFDLTLGYHVLNRDGSYYHSELYSGENEMLSVVEADDGTPHNNPVQLCYTFDSEEQLRGAFKLLSAEGRVRMDVCALPWSPCAAEVVDRFGIRWYLTVPQHRPPEDFSPDDPL